jgi:2-furoyl-CoA dehydrogenase large subunit
MRREMSAYQPDPAMKAPHIGRAVERVEDEALLAGRGRFVDDLAVRPGTAHAAFLRSPHAHAVISSVDTRRAEALDGVIAVLTGHDIAAHTEPFLVGVKQPMEHRAVATDKVRYVGEPVAVVIADDRYVAEDAAALIDVTYAPLAAVIDPARAIEDAAPLLHEAVGSNMISQRDFTYGNPDEAFNQAPHVVKAAVHYPRNACTPMECLALVAEFTGDGAYDVLSNFQGPFALHPVMARALKVPGTRLRLRAPPDSGGSFGVKQSVFPYIVALACAARIAGRPVKWVEDRLEHLVAATSATNRHTTLEAAVDDTGCILALRMEQLEDCGAYLRAPEPASLYRMHSVLTGAYAIPHLSLTNRIVLTNKTPSGLNRGFGGPQLYYALERLMQRIAATLDIDPLTVIRRNLVPSADMPYQTASGGRLDSGDYPATVDAAIEQGGLDALRARRDEARAAGKLYGIGYAAVIEPSMSNMGYITMVLTPEARRRAGPKGGAVSHATVSIDPLGSVMVTADSVPQGQGHKPVAAQVVADALGIAPEAVTVNLELDTQKDPWSIAAGNYSSRFAGAVAGTVHLAATRLRERLARIASQQLNADAGEIAFEGGRLFARGNPDNALSLGRVAGMGHWSPASLPDGAAPGMHESASWTPPTLAPPDEDDSINGSAAYGFIFDFCGVEVDRDTGAVRIDRYVTMHDAGRRLNPALVDGQIRGAFAHAIGAALYEENAYSADGDFLAGTFADYLVPTACEIPEPVILHRDSLSPVTPLGAKGVGEGNCMSTPVCLANAVADALGLDEIDLPLTPDRLSGFTFGPERARPKDMAAPAPVASPKTGRRLTGSGAREVPAPPEAVWRMLLDPDVLARVIPGCESIEATGENEYVAEASIRIGPIRGRFTATIRLSDLVPPSTLTLSGTVAGPLGTGGGEGAVRLEASGQGTRVHYRYDAGVGGKVASVGGRMLDGAARLLIGQFFDRLARTIGGGEEAPAETLIHRLLRRLGVVR